MQNGDASRERSPRALPRHMPLGTVRAPAKSGVPATNEPTSDTQAAPPDMWFVEHLTPYDAYHHGVRELLFAAQSEYQSVTIADTGAYGRALFLDGKIQTAERDEPLYHEPLVHVPCVAHGRPERVLILGGADGGAAREALRWKTLSSVVVVDIDEQVVMACRKYLPSVSDGALDDPRCQVIIGDAMDYIDETDSMFDVIVCDLTDPMEDSPSLALFTVEFFRKLHARLRPRGALSIQVGPASLVESNTLMPRICNTLAAVFEKVHPYQVFVPTYGSPLGMAMATDLMAPLPIPSDVDRIFKLFTNDTLRVMDGVALHGLFALPKTMRKAIDEENQIFTYDNTANAFGKGNLKTN